MKRKKIWKQQEPLGICREEEHSMDTGCAGPGGEINTARAAAATRTSLWLYIYSLDCPSYLRNGASATDCCQEIILYPHNQ